MGLYEGIRDIASVIQKADNIELYQKLLDLSAQALELQAQVNQLTNDNVELRQALNLKQGIIRHKKAYLTLPEDTIDIKYCSHCWDAEHKLIQVVCHEVGAFFCPHCKNKVIYDPEGYSNSRAKSIGVISRGLNI